MPRLLWTQKQDIGPSPRAHSAIAYDAVRRLTYLFGGEAEIQAKGIVYGDTWAWDGRYWTQVARFGPSARNGHTMTFDAARGNTLLFGGEPVTGDALRDSWVFDGVEWTQVEDIGPSPRTRHATAYDSARQRVVLFGGRQIIGGTTTFVNDTWEWDGQSWTQVEADGPGPRSDHVMAFDSSRNRTVMFGGAVADAGGTLRLLGDTWEWSGENWTEVSDTGPGPRNLAAMTSSGGPVIVHGGAVSGLMGDTWQWATGNWSKLQEMGPSPRGAHALAYDSDRQKIVLFGGESNQLSQLYLGDTWEAPGAPAPVSSGTGPANLTVTPPAVSLSTGQGVHVEFDVAPSMATVNFTVVMLGGGGSIAFLGNGQVPAGLTHANLFIPVQTVAAAAQSLMVIPPWDVGVGTDLGSATVGLRLLP